MMNNLSGIENRSKTFHIILGLLGVAVIGFIDYVTGSELSVSVFFLLPIFLVTWFTNRWFGLGISFVSAALWLVVEIITARHYSSIFFPFWNALIRLTFFVIFTVLLSSLKNTLELARTDHLTTAVNARYFYEVVEMELKRFQRYRRPFTIAYIDLDNFKVINDRFGHKVGDQVLITLVNSITEVIRKSDYIARLGGDEFALLFPETDQEAARVVLTKIQNGFVKAMEQKDWSVTFSVGVLTCMVLPGTTQDLIAMTDTLMYSAKNAGKNRIKYSTYTG